jgi:hypothetical protein
MTYLAPPPLAPPQSYAAPPKKRKRWPWIVGGVAALVVIAAVSSAGGGNKTKNTADPALPVSAANSAPAATAVAPPAKASAPAAEEQAHVGDTITVDADSGNVAVTVTQVATTVKATDDFSVPSAGHRFYAVQFVLKPSVDGEGYDDAPSNGAKVVDSEGQQYDASIATDTTAGVSFPVAVRVSPGALSKGWIVFEVPIAAKITGVQFALSSGFGNGAEWIVP